MLTYTTYSEAGGVGKTTLTANLADAHTQQGRDVLVIDLDPQQGSLTYLLGIPASRDDGEADNIARHLIDRPKGEFSDLIQDTPYDFDVIPSHDMLENLPQLLTKAQEIAEDLDEEFAPNDQLRQVLSAAGIPDKYDTVIVDPPATAGPQLYNAVSATRSLVLPVEPTGKGIQSVEGLEDMVVNLEDTLGFNVGILAVVPNGIGSTSNQEQYLAEIQDLGYDAPVALRDRSSLFEGCWDQQCTAFYYVGYHRSGRRDYEVETLDKLRDLAAHIEEVGDQ
ncbi:ParA family protein [Halopenitus persicus]|uniref:Chromosome partitioning protein n=1 Tax=Halopenitus persicus TaxID=1048396 RepID=A0A1H3MUF9_9EURY|nr:ParA family protein [Halopenitus persicus]SDY80352.1 chromosome partitioning protein [Halopenitus persicus]